MAKKTVTYYVCGCTNTDDEAALILHRDEEGKWRTECVDCFKQLPLDEVLESVDEGGNDG
jgi:hypothetical protein